VIEDRASRGEESVARRVMEAPKAAAVVLEENSKVQEHGG